MTFQHLIERHLGLSLRKQADLTEYLGKHDWQVDFEKGTVDFGKASFFSKRRVHPVRTLGTESEVDGTWLWGWANRHIELTPREVEVANELRAFGEKHGIAELTNEGFDCVEITGHVVACVCLGILGADAYYRGPYDGGASYFLVDQVPPGLYPTLPKVTNILMTGISMVAMDHRSFARAYLGDERFTLEESDHQIVAWSPGKLKLTIDFDDQGRIAGVDAEP